MLFADELTATSTRTFRDEIMDMLEGLWRDRGLTIRRHARLGCRRPRSGAPPLRRPREALSPPRSPPLPGGGSRGSAHHPNPPLDGVKTGRVAGFVVSSPAPQTRHSRPARPESGGFAALWGRKRGNPPLWAWRGGRCEDGGAAQPPGADRRVRAGPRGLIPARAGVRGQTRPASPPTRRRSGAAMLGSRFSGNATRTTAGHEPEIAAGCARARHRAEPGAVPRRARAAPPRDPGRARRARRAARRDQDTSSAWRSIPAPTSGSGGSSTCPRRARSDLGSGTRTSCRPRPSRSAAGSTATRTRSRCSWRGRTGCSG